MKKFLIITLLISVHGQASAQLSFGTNGNVGINNKTPESTLHVGQSTNPAPNRVKITTGIANESGLVFDNLTNASLVTTGSGKVLSVDNNGKVVLVTDNTGTTTSYWQLSINDLLNTNTGNIILSNGLKVGNTMTATAGMIRWTGTDFMGYTGSQWISLTGQTPQTLWVSITAGDACKCPTGYTPAADGNTVCRDAQGNGGRAIDRGKAVFFNGDQFIGWFCVNEIQSNYSVNSKNAQCFCKKTSL